MSRAGVSSTVMQRPRQLAFALGHAESFAREDFLAGPSNEAALALIERWPDWPNRMMLLVGPEGSGKSHLAAIWAGQSAAVEASSAREALDAALTKPEPAVLLDDCDGEAVDETELFHLLNAVRERRGSLLLTARSAPTLLWPKLPDLASRLRALPVARLEPPDEETARAVLLKLLDDRQLRVEPEVVAFIVRRVERSLGAVRALVAALDRESLARGRSVGRGLAADVLARTWQDEG